MGKSIDELCCWIASDGTAGMEIQCLGLADALGLSPIVHRIEPRSILRLAPSLAQWPGIAPAAKATPPLTAPWPDLLITCGRRHAGASIAVRRMSAGQTFTVHLQDPRITPWLFDVLVVPEHDPTQGENVIVHTGSLNRLNAEILRTEAEQVAGHLTSMPRPLVAVLVGGGNKGRPVPEAAVRDLATNLRALAADYDCGLMVTMSRRTDPAHAEILREALAQVPAWIWDGQGFNPYFGFLAAADAIIVTSDSVNMVSEACSTGKPVHLVDLVQPVGRLARFLDGLARKGMTRAFDGTLKQWDYQPLSETKRVAGMVRERLRVRYPDAVAD